MVHVQSYWRIGTNYHDYGPVRGWPTSDHHKLYYTVVRCFPLRELNTINGNSRNPIIQRAI